MQDCTAECHGSEPRQEFRRCEGAPLDEELGYLLHDAAPELLGPEAVELVLDLLDVREDGRGLVISGTGPGCERGVLGLDGLDHPKQELAVLFVVGRHCYGGLALGPLLEVRDKGLTCLPYGVRLVGEFDLGVVAALLAPKAQVLVVLPRGSADGQGSRTLRNAPHIRSLMPEPMSHQLTG